MSWPAAGRGRWCCCAARVPPVRRPSCSTALLAPVSPIPVLTLDATPSWIGPLDVVVAHTADRDDIALAESVQPAVRRGAEVVLSAPADGPVASAGAGRARLVEPRIPVPPGLDLPRALAVGLTVAGALELAGAPLPAGAGPAGRPARRRGRAQPAGPRAVHEPGEVAGAAARRAHPAAVGHRPAGHRGGRARGRRRWPRTPGWSRTPPTSAGRPAPPGWSARWTGPPAGRRHLP